MILSFKCRYTEDVWNGCRTRKFPVDTQSRILRKLRMLHVAKTTQDLRNPPGNHLERLLGNRKGQMSIRVNNRYRLCFIFKDSNAEEVEVVDYH